MPQITGPSEINQCTKIFADASLSSGKSGRPFSSVEWGLDYSRSYVANGVLAAGERPHFVRREIHLTQTLPNSLVGTDIL